MRIAISRRSRLLPGAALMLLAGCGYGASRSVHQAQFSMIGMSANDLQACAGPPDRIVQLNPAAQIFAYSDKPGVAGGLGLPIPLLGTITPGGGGGTCLAEFRLVDNRVTELHVTGDDDRVLGSEGVCGPIIRGCMRQSEPTMRPVSGEAAGSISAYRSPPVPALPAGAEYTAPAAAK